MSQQGYTEQITRLIEQQGAARARAAEQSGAIWGGALANLGQIPAQMQQAERIKQQAALQKQQGELTGLEIKAKTQDMADQQATRDALSSSGGDLEKALPAIMRTNPVAGMKLQDALRQQKQALMEYHGKVLDHIAAAVGPIADATDPQSQQAAIDLAHSRLQALGIPTDDLPKQAGPDATRIAAAFRQGTLTAKDQLAANSAAKTAEARAASAAKPTTATLAVDAVGADQDKAAAAKAALDLLKPPKDTSEKSIQTKSVLLDGKPAEINFNPAGGKWEFNGQEVDPTRIKPMPPASVVYPKPEKPDKLVRVEHKGEDGKTVIEYLPESEVRGKTFEKGDPAAVANRIASAKAVYQTGDDIIAKLKDPAFSKVIGPAMGRASTLREFIGNPPPEFAELAGNIESYALANMGVHGMRSNEGAEKIKRMLDAHHTPESLAAAIRGLNNFSQHFMENEGHAVPKQTSGGSAPKVGDEKTFPNGSKGQWDGHGWVKIGG
jgi:hypothetical protein